MKTYSTTIKIEFEAEDKNSAENFLDAFTAGVNALEDINKASGNGFLTEVRPRLPVGTVLTSTDDFYQAPVGTKVEVGHHSYGLWWEKLEDGSWVSQNRYGAHTGERFAHEVLTGNKPSRKVLA